MTDEELSKKADQEEAQLRAYIRNEIIPKMYPNYEDVIKEAMKYCEEHNIMKEYLKENEDKVVEMMLAEKEEEIFQGVVEKLMEMQE